MIPTEVVKPPSGDLWLHEIKHDSYRMQLVKAGERVRLFTRRGGDWTKERKKQLSKLLKRSEQTGIAYGEHVEGNDAGGIQARLCDGP
jgi:ATP-dependent DNA ligase